MGLRGKFNLAVCAAFLVGFALAATALQQLSLAQARAQVLQNARIMMSAADAIRHYTVKEVAPVVGFDSGGKFIPASVPAFAAQTTFREVQAQYPDYSYREPTLNPTNPADRASDWEADFINAFRNSAGLSELTGMRETPTGQVLSLARPIAVNSPDCLICHSTPEHAPAALRATYGDANGFGWKLHEVVGAQVVSVPLALSMAAARQSFLIFIAILLATFVLVLVILNVLLHYMVIRPVMQVARIANAVSLGETEIPEYERKGRDEIAVLSAAFNRMRRSLDSAMRMLER